MTKVGLISDEGPVNAHVGSVSSNLAQSTGKTLRLKKIQAASRINQSVSHPRC